MGCGCGKKFTRPSTGAARTGQTITSAPLNKTGAAPNVIRSSSTPQFKAGRTGIVRGRV
jgi:hypothetical protein